MIERSQLVDKTKRAMRRNIGFQPSIRGKDETDTFKNERQETHSMFVTASCKLGYKHQYIELNTAVDINDFEIEKPEVVEIESVDDEELAWHIFGQFKEEERLSAGSEREAEFYYRGEDNDCWPPLVESYEYMK
jgi:fibronectin type 3 domain-containing protein